jgi:hypothetical protein
MTAHPFHVTIVGATEVRREDGPVKVLEIEFPGNRFTGAIVPELRSLVDEVRAALAERLAVPRMNDGPRMPGTRRRSRWSEPCYSDSSAERSLGS